jgi:3-oxoacyl-[acyl-carrier-protein] synthase III
MNATITTVKPPPLTAATVLIVGLFGAEVAAAVRIGLDEVVLVVLGGTIAGCVGDGDAAGAGCGTVLFGDEAAVLVDADELDFEELPVLLGGGCTGVLTVIVPEPFMHPELGHVP